MNLLIKSSCLSWVDEGESCPRRLDPEKDTKSTRSEKMENNRKDLKTGVSSKRNIVSTVTENRGFTVLIQIRTKISLAFSSIFRPERGEIYDKAVAN
ncbi:hypothetical protein SCA6_008547 [Theobroma cacao]